MCKYTSIFNWILVKHLLYTFATVWQYYLSSNNFFMHGIYAWECWKYIPELVQAKIKKQKKIKTRGKKLLTHSKQYDIKDEKLSNFNKLVMMSCYYWSTKWLMMKHIENIYRIVWHLVNVTISWTWIKVSIIKTQQKSEILNICRTSNLTKDKIKCFTLTSCLALIFSDILR